MRKAEEILRGALAEYADTANWMPTHINTDTGNIVHLFWCAGRAGENGWQVAEDALRETKNERSFAALRRVATLMREYLTIPHDNKLSPLENSPVFGQLLEAMAEAGYPVGEVRHFKDGV